ncbi:hypothetical protein BGW38_000865 [Lunasporangiospora selenospora]|uniref:Uncharacterized protein n=1 Tax=Lunasporangiospora selenospora TaxID=979761 RepID=A0A9P6FU88_9FUNG|nr:hypothetical protein BGW38_000865 [Lunasporangiospora selenospora]
MASSTLSTKQPFTVLSESPEKFRWIEVTTECRHIESLFSIVSDARDAQLFKLINVPQSNSRASTLVTRSVALRLDQNDPENFGRTPEGMSKHRTRPLFMDLFRVECRIIRFGRSSILFENLVWSVPKSQQGRDFNDRSQDALYQELAPGEEPQRLLASATSSLVWVKTIIDKDGHERFQPAEMPFRDESIVSPSVIQLRCPDPLRLSAPGTPRPPNAFRVPLCLRMSDIDQLGHVTNSRYPSFIHDVLTYGLEQGYYANGFGPLKTTKDLPSISIGDEGCGNSRTVIGSNDPRSAQIAVRSGAQFYRKAKIHELYVGYEQELKVQDGSSVWSWVEKDRVQGKFDVVRFEICFLNSKGEDEVASISRALIHEHALQKASL